VLRRQEGAREVRGLVCPQVVEHGEVEDQQGDSPLVNASRSLRLLTERAAAPGTPSETPDICGPAACRGVVIWVT
jgi:hypothetical protein